MKLADRVRRETAIGKIAAGDFGVGRFEQETMKLLFRPGHHVEQPAFVAARRLIRCAARLRPERDARLLGQQLERFAKFQSFGLHHEAEHVAADVADPAFP